MPRNESPLEKEESLGYVVKVQQVIDFIVLAELQKNGRLYAREMDQEIIRILDGVGVNDSYLSQRLKKLAESGHVKRQWDGDNRYNRYYEITDLGVEYFKLLLRDLPDRVKQALRVYTLFDNYIKQYGHVNLK